MKFLVACFAVLCLAMVTKAANENSTAATNSTTAMVTTATTMATTMPPKRSTYQVKDANGTVCMEMDAILVLSVMYDVAGENKTATGTLPVPPEPTTTVTGKCSTNGSDPEMTLSFDTDTNIVKFVFHNDNGTAVISHIDFKIRLDKAHFPNATRQGDFVMDNETVTFKLGNGTFNKYYMCDATEPLNGQNATIRFSLLKVQAFGMAGKFSDQGFGCDQDKTTAMTSTPAITTMPANTSTPTTPANTSTPTTPAMTTPNPTPGAPTVNNFTVGDNKTVCIVMDVGLQIKIDYNSTKGETKNTTVNVPSGLDATGTCGNDTDTLKVLFFKNKWMLEFAFAMVQSAENDEMFSLENITLTYDIDELVNVKDAQKGQHGTIMAVNKNAFKSKAGAEGGYKCTATTMIEFDGNKDNQLITTDMRLQAFRKTNTTHIDDNKNLTVCPKDEETNNIVPIAVGAALAALVVIVLIAYLIGRKRSHKGYESV